MAAILQMTFFNPFCQLNILYFDSNLAHVGTEGSNWQSSLVQIMAWHEWQVTSHYLSQWWPTSMMPYGINGPQCVTKQSWWQWVTYIPYISYTDSNSFSHRMYLSCRNPAEGLVCKSTCCTSAVLMVSRSTDKISGEARQIKHNICDPINSVAPGRFGFHFKNAIFNFILLTGSFRSPHDNVLRWTSWNLTDDKSTFGLGNGLVPSGHKPSPQPLLIQFCVTIWRH